MANDDTTTSRTSGWAEIIPRATGEIDISIAYSNPPTNKLMNLYADWAETYDSDLIGAYGYMAPADAVAAFTELGLAKDASVLDAGCGTGQVGTLLAAAGYTCVDGADLSPEMRNVAARLGVYRNLYRLDMTADYALQIGSALGTELAPAPPYDAVICVGVFGYGPPHVEDLPRIMDAAAAGAPVLVTVNGMGWLKMGWDEALPLALESAGIKLQSRRRIRHMVSEGIEAELLQLRRG